MPLPIKQRSGTCRLYCKFLLLFVPVFVAACGFGLYLVAERARSSAVDHLTARIGNQAARVAITLDSVVQSAADDGTRRINQHLIDTLLADNAIVCAEYRLDRMREADLKSPFGVGCAGAEGHEELRLETGEDERGELLIRFSTDEISAAVLERREFSLAILLAGLFVALLASAAGFRLFVTRPLRRLLDAVETAPDSGTHQAVRVSGHDEISHVTLAYNTLQSRIADFSERLEERVKERTFAAEAAAAEARHANEELQNEILVRKEAEHDLLSNAVRLQEQQLALNKLIREGNLVGPKWRVAIRRINETCVATLGMQSSSVWLFSEDWTELACVDKHDVQGGIVPPEPALKVADLPSYVATVHSSDIIVVDDLKSDTRLREFPEYLGANAKVAAVLDAPIVRNGKLIGFVRLEQSGQPIAWTTDQQVFATAVASMIAMVCESRDRFLVEEELRSSNEALEIATKAKSEFLATMSHEIRTPMNGVLGMLELLVDSELTSEQTDLCHTARNAAQGLLGILNDILDLSRVEAGAVSIETTSFDIRALVSEVVTLLAPGAAHKGLQLDVDIDAGVPEFLLSDPARLRQVLFNLVGNAIKFTSEGGIAISVVKPSDRVRIEVTDTGIGIPQDRIPDLFTRFTQLDSSNTRRFGGTGLGLAISKQLVELMSGEMGADSVSGKGSQFWFEVPMQEGSRPRPEPAEEGVSVHRRACASLRVLLAEDNAVNQKFMRLLLQKMGHSVDIVSNGGEAVRAVSEADYDVVLMDVQMPEMDGPTATRAIRDLGGPHALIPVIAVTANVLPSLVESYREAGITDCIEKPVRRAALEQKLNELSASKSAAMAVVGDQPPELAPAQAVECRAVDIGCLPLIDQDALDAWQDGFDAEEVHAALSIVPHEGGKCINQIRTALQGGDMASARRGAHCLKGMAGNLGAPRLMAAARELELGEFDADGAIRQATGLEEIFEETLVALQEAMPGSRDLESPRARSLCDSEALLDA